MISAQTTTTSNTAISGTTTSDTKTSGTRVSNTIAEAVETWRETLLTYSHEIHADPELSGDEHRAAERTRTILRSAGFDLSGRQPQAPTALSATFGTGSFVVSFCVEYDALPDIGHACGHNVNAASALGAALALTAVADDLDLEIHVLGTPAEEAHGGKVDLIEEGFFADTHAAAMAHAAAQDAAGGSSLALCAWSVDYRGVAAHAAGAPSTGRNALDAAHIAQTAIALARQQLPPESVVSLNVTHGGDAVNIIPDHAGLTVEMRSPSSGGLTLIRDRVEKCLRAGALATDCEIAIEEQGHPFADLRQDADLTRAYVAAAAQRGRTVPISSKAVASTDMGNVSHIIPSIHPQIGYEVHGAVNHNADFTAHGTSASADLAVLDAAFSLATTMAIAAENAELRARLMSQHD